MNAPEKLYYAPYGDIREDYPITDNDIEYVRKDAFIGKVINFLNYKLDNVVAIRVPGTLIPHRVAKQELIEDFRKDMKGE